MNLTRILNMPEVNEVERESMTLIFLRLLYKKGYYYGLWKEDILLPSESDMNRKPHNKTPERYRQLLKKLEEKKMIRKMGRYKIGGRWRQYYIAKEELIDEFISTLSFYLEEKRYIRNFINDNYKKAYENFMLQFHKESNFMRHKENFSKAFFHMFKSFIRISPEYSLSESNLYHPLNRFLKYIKYSLYSKKQSKNLFDETLEYHIIMDILAIVYSIGDKYLPKEVLNPLKSLKPKERYDKILDYISGQKKGHIIRECFGNNWQESLSERIKIERKKEGLLRI